jgi:hypothetical protein
VYPRGAARKVDDGASSGSHEAMGDPRRERTDDAPSGLPSEDAEEGPLGVPDARPEGEDEPARGPDAMPGIPTEGEPPGAG